MAKEEKMNRDWSDSGFGEERASTSERTVDTGDVEEDELTLDRQLPKDTLRMTQPRCLLASVFYLSFFS